jgi:hypothetical protein
MSTEKKAAIELLPNAEFILTTESGTQFKGRFSTYTLERFCDMKDIPNYLTLLIRITIGIKIGDYIDLILFGVQGSYNLPDECPLKRKNVADFIDEMGGPVSEKVQGLIEHAIARVVDLKRKAEEKQSDQDDDDKDKKKESSSSSTESNSESGPLNVA